MIEQNVRSRDFEGAIVPVLGGGGLLGSAIVEVLALQNAHPVIVDINIDRGEKLVQNIRKQNATASFMFADLSEPDKLVILIKKIEQHYGVSQGWVNSFYPRTDDWNQKLENVPLNSWRKNVDMHLNGTCVCSSEVAQLMAGRGGGAIVNIGSIYGLVAPNFTNYDETEMTSPAAYSAIKGGISAYSKYLASYYGKHNVRVNTVIPGGIFNNQPESFLRRYCEKTALRRLANATEVANAVAFLISDEASYITGVDMPVDGGFLAM